MTSRRDFLGLLAASPLVAPVVAKEMAAPASAWSRKLVGGEALIGSDIIEGPFLTTEGGWISVNRRYHGQRRYTWTAVDPGRDCEFATTDIPNRLYGVSINSDGDAI